MLANNSAIKNYLTGKNIICFGIALVLVGMPLSKFLMGLSNFVMFAGWLIDGNFKQKFSNFKSNRFIHLTILIFIVHVAALSYTSNFNYAFNDLRIKLPLLILPILIGTSEVLNEHVFKVLVKIFISAVFVATIISTFVWLGFGKKTIADVRDISIFISHIRFSLMICLSFFYANYFYRCENMRLQKALWLLVCGWFLIFLVILQSFTGLVVLAIVLLSFLIYKGVKSKRTVVKYLTIFAVVIPVASGVLYVRKVNKEFTNVPQINLDTLQKFTANGTPYHHTNEYNEIENGNFVGIYLSEPELKEAWKKRSDIDYDGLDKRGQPIKFTLMRYLTSVGLRKDANGVYMLKAEDIESIEAGMPNYKYKNRFSLYPRIHQILYEYYSYKNGKEINGYSVIMRAYFLGNAWDVFKQNKLIGVGTGDIVDEEQKQYYFGGSALSEEYRLHAHNQIVSFLVTFGIIGFGLVLLSIYFPLGIKHFRQNYFYMVFIAIITLSMLNEDTFETQAGVSLFAVFNTLILFSFKGREKTK